MAEPQEQCPIPCRRCGASMSVVAPDALLASHHARCSYCGATEPLPADVEERVKGLRIRLAELRFAEQLEVGALGSLRAYGRELAPRLEACAPLADGAPLFTMLLAALLAGFFTTVQGT